MIYFLISAFLSLSAFSQNTESDQVIHSGSSIRAATLGLAYDTKSQSFKSKCVEGEEVRGGQSVGSIGFDSSISEKKLSEELGLKVGMKARYGAVSASLNSDFLQKAMNTSLSVSAIYKAEHHFESVMIPEVKWTKDAEKLKTENSERLKASCGDQFVTEIRRRRKTLCFHTCGVLIIRENQKKILLSKI